MKKEMPVLPVPNVDSTEYWKATADGNLMLCRCVETGTWIHPPLERSRTGGPVRFEEVSGRGTIFSFIVVRHPLVPGHQVPYVVGLVELDEQPGLRMSGIIAADPAEIKVGSRVQAQITDIGDSGFRAPEFKLITE